MPTNLSNSKGRNLSLVVVLGCEGVIAYDVTLGTYNTNKFLVFIKTKVISSLDRQRFILMNNVPFHKSRETQQGFERCWTQLLPFAIINPFLNDAKWVFG